MDEHRHGKRLGKGKEKRESKGVEVVSWPTCRSHEMDLVSN